jgi:hypothetical protein
MANRWRLARSSTVINPETERGCKIALQSCIHCARLKAVKTWSHLMGLLYTTGSRKENGGNMSDINKTTKMGAMFLPGVEENPQPGPYADALRVMQAAGSEYSQIWHMFAFKPQATDHLARFTQEIMREPAPLSPWIRELIAAFTSARNDCPF